jgi:hypothetical protein
VIELAAPLLEPVLEVDRVVEVEAVQQRPRVGVDDRLQVVGRHRYAELVEVAAQPGRIEEQGVARRGDCSLSECRAQDVHRQVEQPAGVGRVPLRPEQRHGAVARQRLRPGGDDEGEQGDPMALRRRPGDRRVPGAQRGAPKQLDRDHRLT